MLEFCYPGTSKQKQVCNLQSIHLCVFIFRDELNPIKKVSIHHAAARGTGVALAF